MERQATWKMDIGFLRLTDQLNVDEQGTWKMKGYFCAWPARAESYQWQSEGRRAISRNNTILQEITQIQFSMSMLRFNSTLKLH